MTQDLSVYTNQYYERPLAEFWFEQFGLVRPDQLAALSYAYGISPWNGAWTQRNPGIIYSIGCGTGMLEVTLEKMGNVVIGVDPSTGAKNKYRGSKLIDKYEGGGDTIMFVESIEHIPMAELDRIFSLVPSGARIIVVNWPDFHPINPFPGHDHITLIDDQMFDRISALGTTVLRRGSHLVVDKL